MPGRGKRVLIIVQNLSVPLDRRVWLECLALRDAGLGVSVICPRGAGDTRYQELNGVRIYRYPPPPVARGSLGYLWEFVYCWIVTALLSVVVGVRDRFDAIQACNPPDTYWALGLLWRPFGKKFVYDQHDLNPEVFLSRFGQPTGVVGRLQLRMLLFLERMTYRVADRVVSTNESYRSIALTRGKVLASHATVVRSGPDTTVMRPVQPEDELRRGHRYLAVYLGIMGPQDGVDITLRALEVLVKKFGRTDCQLALLGFGDCLDELKQLAHELGLDEHVEFTGRVGPSEIARYLSTADVGLCPDPKSPLNDVSTMNKTMEYMAYALPIVTFDLVETRVSAADSAIYLESGDIVGFAEAWQQLLDDQDLRVDLGTRARARVVAELDWKPQAEKYVSMWRELLDHHAGASRSGGRHAAADHVPAPAAVGNYLNLEDPAQLARYIGLRGREG